MKTAQTSVKRDTCRFFMLVFSLHTLDLGLGLRSATQGTEENFSTKSWRLEEIADAVALLFSERSSYYAGQSLTLDGGLTAQRPSLQKLDNKSIVVRPEDEVIREAELRSSGPSIKAIAI